MSHLSEVLHCLAFFLFVIPNVTVRFNQPEIPMKSRTFPKQILEMCYCCYTALTTLSLPSAINQNTKGSFNTVGDLEL